MAGLLILGAVEAKANLINPDFEAYTGMGLDLLPGWTVQTNDIGYPLLDMLPISTAGIGLVNSNGFYDAIDGDYSLYLAAGHATNQPFTPATVSISQTFQVPNMATVMRITTDHIPTNQLALSLIYNYTLNSIDLTQGNTIPLGGGIYSLENDISSLAGQMATLTFTIDIDPALGGAWHRFDAIQVVIPEPGSLALLIVGTMIMIRVIRRKKLNGLFS